MQHPLTPPEKLWLTELARSPGLSVKFAKVKLYLSPVNQDGKRDNQDGKFFEGVISGRFGSDLTRLEGDLDLIWGPARR
jgi:hypothetical protein